MANVIDPMNRSRGQLIIVTGLLVAVSLVAITLFLNTAIYSENLASRGSDIGENDALEVVNVMEESIGEMIDWENSREHADYTDVEDNVSVGMDEINKSIIHRNAIQGKSVDVLNVTLDEGRLLRQTNSSRNLTNASWETEWTLVTDLEDTRMFKVNISNDLNSTSLPDGESFTVVVNDSNVDSWKVYFYDDDGPTLAVKNGTDSSPSELNCGFDYNVTVDLTRGEVGGESCDSLVFGKGVSSPYDIRFEGGHEAVGTYNLTVNTSSVESGNFNDQNEDSPRELAAVYSVRFDVFF